MWLFLPDSFLSVVEHREIPGIVLVRSRIEGDIQRLLPDAEVWEDADADYRYRAEVSKDDLKVAVCGAIDAIDYPNFKNAVRDEPRHRAYFQVWQAMNQAYR